CVRHDYGLNLRYFEFW
nr:immunoglobulin heavy chain junction region [Macaca mulatta]